MCFPLWNGFNRCSTDSDAPINLTRQGWRGIRTGLITERSSQKVHNLVELSAPVPRVSSFWAAPEVFSGDPRLVPYLSEFWSSKKTEVTLISTGSRRWYWPKEESKRTWMSRFYCWRKGKHKMDFMTVITVKKRSKGRVTTGVIVTNVAGTARTVMPACFLVIYHLTIPAWWYCKPAWW